jgi:hypothetical protein
MFSEGLSTQNKGESFLMSCCPPSFTKPTSPKELIDIISSLEKKKALCQVYVPNIVLLLFFFLIISYLQLQYKKN